MSARRDVDESADRGGGRAENARTANRTVIEHIGEGETSSACIGTEQTCTRTRA